MRLFSKLPVTAAAAACLLVPAQAAAAPLPAGSTAILSGTPTLDGAFPTPVGVVNFGRFTVSANGRFIVFASTSDGLSDEDDDRHQNIFVKDMTTGAVTLMSRRDGADGAPVQGQCSSPSISDDGSTVAFRCEAPLDPADTNTNADAYVRKLATNETILVSRVPGGPVGDHQSFLPVLSADGTVVVFESLATNLGAGNTSPGEHVYRRDLKPGGQLTVVSRRSAADGGTVTTGGDPSVSDDGNVVAWAHQGSGPPDPGDTNGKFDVYVSDVVAGTTVLASVATNGTRGDGPSELPAIAGDGSAVAFESGSTTFDPADTESGRDIYRRTLGANPTTALVSIEGTTKGVDSRSASISADGRMIAFASRATGFDGADADPEYSAYVRDMQTPQITLLNRGDGDDGAFIPGLTLGVATSGDGRKFAAVSTDGRGVPGADRYGTTLFLRELGSSPARTRHVSRPPGDAPFVNVGGFASTPRLSADTRYAAFLTRAPLLVPDGLAGAIAIRDRVTGELTIASRADGANGAFLDGDGDPSISADGRRVAFVVHDGPLYSVWVRDLAANRTFLVSRASGAQGAPATEHAFSPLLSANGSRVVFRTRAKLDGGDTDALEDIYVRDLESHETTLASRATGATGAKGNGASAVTAGISADGETVLFLSASTNLAGGDTDTGLDAYLRHVENETTALVGTAPDGTKPNGPVTFASLDAAGNRVAFATAATNLGVDTPHSKAFVRDLEAGTLTLASRVDGSDATPLNGPALNPVLSPDGGYVAFRSSATDLPGTTAGGPAIGFLHDLERRTTQLVTRASGVDGAPVREVINDTMTVSRGGGCVTFATGAGLFGPYSDGRQAYIRAVRDECAPTDPEPEGPGEPGEPGPTGPDGGGTPGGGAGAGPDPGPGGGPADGRDLIAPGLTAAKLSRKRIRSGQRSVLSFRTNEAGSLALTYERVRGKRVKRAGASSHRIKVGPGRITLTGKVGRKRLAAGTYRVTLVARDAAGNRSKPVRLKLTILRR